MFRRKTLHETRCMSRCDETASPQLPIAAAFWIIQTVFMKECSGLTQNWMPVCSSTHSITLNVMVTQYTCSLTGVYHPHWLVQRNSHCSHMRIPVHSPWLPGYIDVEQTVLLMLTMSTLFPDGPIITHLSENWNIWTISEFGSTGYFFSWLCITFSYFSSYLINFDPIPGILYKREVEAMVIIHFLKIILLLLSSN